MTKPRYTMINNDEKGVYHCISRCVQRAYLCGVDATTGRDYSERKEWIVERMQELAQIFFVDVLAFAVMDNHLHLVLENRPDLVGGCTDEEIAKRWWNLLPKRRNLIGKPEPPTLLEIGTLTDDVDQIATWRKRLSSISWYMSYLKQPIARRANEQMETTGRFWEGRFKSIALLDKAAILSCVSYVELNPIRAKIAETPESSDYTSCQLRIISRQVKKAREARGPEVFGNLPSEMLHLLSPDHWLAPIEDDGKRLGFLDMSVDDYLEVIDWTGRNLAGENKGVIPDHLAPILTRLNINPEKWLETSRYFGKRFSRVAGTVSNIQAMAEMREQHWFHGVSVSREWFNVA